MAVAQVESEHFPYLRLALTVGGRAVRVEALVDTGFDGDILVPLSLVADGQPPDEYRSWGLADGSEITTPVYRGTVQVGSLATEPANIALLGDEAIVGRGVTDRYRVILDHGERVIVQP